MAGSPRPSAGPGLPGTSAPQRRVPDRHTPSRRWRVGDLLMRGSPPSCWPEPPPGRYWFARLVPVASPSSLPAARDFVRKSLADWGLTDLTWDATTIVSELLTNAITHAANPPHLPAQPIALQVMLLCQGGRLIILVTDPSALPPVRHADPEPGALGKPGDPRVTEPLDEADDSEWLGELCDLGEVLLAESGRGLHIVAGLSLDWGWAPVVSGGKAVWAVLDESRTGGRGADARRS